MKTTLHVKPTTKEDILSDSRNGNLLVVTEDYKPGDSFEISEGTVLLNVYGNIIAFLSNGELRFWSEGTVKNSPIAAVSQLKLRKAQPGEGVTLSA